MRNFQLLPLLSLLSGCYGSADQAGLHIEVQSGSSEPEARQPGAWDSNFPAQADLAILLDTLDEPLIDFNTLDNSGDGFLPAAWLARVNEAYSQTFVEDALELENDDYNWRLVSVRVSPCAPIGIRPDVDIDQWCWPTVRLVWQPVLSDFRLSWGVYTDFYADDRAIHAIFPVAPRDRQGNKITGEWREQVGLHLAANKSPGELSSQLRAGFSAVRDASATAVLAALHDLRDPSIPPSAYERMDLRPEQLTDTSRRSRFRDGLRDFLSEFAPWQGLEEMTSFSLPEGREPASIDIWVFVGFDGNKGFPSLKELNVISRTSGQELVRIGTSQTIAVGVEDESIEQAINSGNTELENSLIFSSEDIEEKGDAMADPYQFLVPNTSCASCHRLNPLRFDFHALSGFENRGISISPRVNRDVARDMFWARHVLSQ